jgi:ABC-2 type transport system ATP-binding protein
MLLEAKNLTKYYGDFPAVADMTFSIDRGEIVGMLGPNGAGKSTTMRMLSCYLPPSSGTAYIAGYEIMKDSNYVRRHVGYMPENNPLYDEMRVTEYLRYRAQLKGVPRRIRIRRIDHCINLCSVADAEKQIIGTLSKGYRQRVGLADALLGNPDVLILDEPTIGLDPNQIRKTRSTIQALSKDHTILMSTHILQEVEAICQRAIIINEGRIIADDTVDNLSCQYVQTVVKAEIKVDRKLLADKLSALEGVDSMEVHDSGGWCIVELSQQGDGDVREEVSHLAARNGWPLRKLDIKRTALEDVFQKLTENTENKNLE